MNRKSLLVLCSALLVVMMPALFCQASEQKFTAHAPIRINGNSGFTSANGVVAGNGTYENPYVIEGWEIDGSGSGFGIFIGNATDYFVIRNCYIYNANGNTGEFTKNSGIFLYNSINGKIERNTVSNCGFGIYSVFSSNIVINATMVSNCSDAGIMLYMCDTFSVLGCSLANNPSGISLDTSESCTISACTFSACGILISGESLENWNSHTISQTNIVNGKPLRYYANTNNVDVPESGEVILANCTGITVKNRTMAGASTSLVAGFTNLVQIENCNFSQNKISGAEFYRCMEITINTTKVTQNGGDGLRFTYSHWCRLYSVEAGQNSAGGIVLTNSNNNTLNEVRCNGNLKTGINLVESQDNYIINSQSEYNGEDGILSFTADGNMIYGSKANHNGRYGISIAYSQGNSVVGCNATANFAGIRLYRADGNKIAGNTAMNGDAGINLNYSCHSNEIFGNILANNNYGLFLRYSDANNISENRFKSNSIGAMLQNSNTNNLNSNDFITNSIFGVNISSGSSDNRIYRNNFISNGQMYKQSADNGSNNYWNQSNAGNFWDDWTSPDSDANGIVDNPYLINGTAGAMDYLPLTSKASTIQIIHSPPGIVDTDQDIPIVADISSIYNLTEAKLYYKEVGSSTWLAIAMTRVSGTPTNGTYQATISAQHTYGILEYYISASDEKGEVVQTPVYSITVVSPAPESSLVLLLLICGCIFTLRKRGH